MLGTQAATHSGLLLTVSDTETTINHPGEIFGGGSTTVVFHRTHSNDAVITAIDGWIDREIVGWING